jgi:hypothetical protein
MCHTAPSQSISIRSTAILSPHRYAVLRFSASCCSRNKLYIFHFLLRTGYNSRRRRRRIAFVPHVQLIQSKLSATRLNHTMFCRTSLYTYYVCILQSFLWNPEFITVSHKKPATESYPQLAGSDTPLKLYTCYIHCMIVLPSISQSLKLSLPLKFPD